MTGNQNTRLLGCGWCYEEQGEEVHPHPECPVGQVAAPAAAPVAVPPTDRAGLRELIAEALMAWAERNNSPQYARARRSETVTANAYSRADAVLPVLPADAEPHRLALSDALGLGTSAPWDAIRARAAELAVPPVAVDRGAVYRELADQQTQLAVADDLARRRDVAGARRQLVKELRQLAAGTPQPETQADGTLLAELQQHLAEHTPSCNARTDHLMRRAAAALGAPAVTLPGKEA